MPEPQQHRNGHAQSEAKQTNRNTRVIINATHKGIGNNKRLHWNDFGSVVAPV